MSFSGDSDGVEEAFAAAPLSPGQPLTLEALQRHDQQTTFRFFQFGCEKCDRVFWRKADPTNPVAGCRVCRTHLVPVPRERVIGYATFNCTDCDNTFTNNRAMYDCTQPCRLCKKPLLPEGVIGPPPRRYGSIPQGGVARRQRRTSDGSTVVEERRYTKTGHRHSCSKCPTGECNIKPMSSEHDCTGSTIRTDTDSVFEVPGRGSRPPGTARFEQEVNVQSDFTAGRMYAVNSRGRPQFAPSLSSIRSVSGYEGWDD